MERELLLEELEPFVRSALVVPLPPLIGQSMHKSYDNRMFYLLSGSATVVLNGKSTRLSQGSVVYWTAGTEYTFFFEERDVPRVIAVNFDFTQEHTRLDRCLPSVEPSGYREEDRLERIRVKNAPVLNGAFVLTDGTELFGDLQRMVREAAGGLRFSGLLQRDLMRAVLALLCRRGEAESASRGGDAFRQVLEYVREHYLESLTNQTVAERFGYHPNYISQLFREHTEVPLHRYLLQLRIRRALTLLQTTDAPIGEVAREAGFENVGYFCRYLKKTTGHSPSSYRKGAL